MSRPSTLDMLYHLSSTFGMPISEVLAGLKVPQHPEELRDRFATAALQGLLADPRPFEDEGEGIHIAYAKTAYMYADAMLEARK